MGTSCSRSNASTSDMISSPMVMSPTWSVSNGNSLKICTLDPDFSNQYVPNLPNDPEGYHQPGSYDHDPNEIKTSTDGKEDRVRATDDHYDDPSSFIHSIGLVRSRFDIKQPTDQIKRSCFVGTAVILNTNTDNLYLLTAAHMVIRRNRYLRKNIKAQSMFFELRKNTNGWGTKNKSTKTRRFTVSNYWVHPQYTATPYCDSGYDIAILKCGDLENHIHVINRKRIATIDNFEQILDAIKQYELNRNSGCEFKACLDLVKRKVKSNVKRDGYVVGFPAEKKGQLYGMKGNLVTSIRNKLIFMYVDISTTGGQSGSPILASDNITDDVYASNKYVIGIHTAGQDGYNWGTKITKNMYKWITETMNYDINSDKVNFKGMILAYLRIEHEAPRYFSGQGKILNEIEEYCIKDILQQHNNYNIDDADDDLLQFGDAQNALNFGNKKNKNRMDEWIQNRLDTYRPNELVRGRLQNGTCKLIFGYKSWTLNMTAIANQFKNISSIQSTEKAKYASLSHKMRSLKLRTF